MNQKPPLLTQTQAQALLDCAVGPAFLLRDSSILYCNAEAARWLDCENPQSMSGRSLLYWSAQLQSNSLPSAPMFHALLQQVTQTGPQTLDWTFQRSDGMDLFARMNLRLIDVEDQGPVFHVLAQDISDLKLDGERMTRHIERFRRMFDASPDPMWLVKSNVFVGCNHAAVRLLGYASRSELLNKHPSELSPPSQPDGEDSHAKANRMGKLAHKQGMHRFEWVHLRANGEHFWAEVTLTPIEIDIGSVMLCAWRDISGRKKREEMLSAVIDDLNARLARCTGCE